ncbi:MAG TPA: DUF1028 domain-containing protein [Usitatibacter sp.]|jgi:uncharacterized Ntn-hydrolase superfamily protein|nr:DUF1028 domain-containing protein [Usitatibacter sp.]
MTWSLVARDASGAFGVAVASRFFAVGALCPAIRSGHGALSTQALINPLFAHDGLALLGEGLSAQEVIDQLVAADAGRDARQVHAIDAAGRTAAHTGSACIAWCGHRAGDGYSLAGNMLAGPQVLDETARAYEANASLTFASRLIAAMQAGEAAGGDKRGKQAAALLVHGTEPYPFLDLRVDDHPEPLQELARLYRVSLERYQPFWSCLPSGRDPVGITDRSIIEARIAAFQATLRADKA